MWLLDRIVIVRISFLYYWEHHTIYHSLPQIPAAFITVVKWDLENIFNVLKVFKVPMMEDEDGKSCSKKFFPTAKSQNLLLSMS